MRTKTLQQVATSMQEWPDNAGLTVAECLEILKEENDLGRDCNATTRVIEFEDGSLKRVH